jgi:hypothetical protein
VLEDPVWELVSRLLKDFDLLQAGLELFIEEELRSVLVDPNKETESWAKKLVEVDRKRSAFDSPTPHHRGRWYEDVGKERRPRPVRTECCDSVRPDVSNLTNLSLVMGAGLVNFGSVLYV